MFSRREGQNLTKKLIWSSAAIVCNFTYSGINLLFHLLTIRAMLLMHCFSVQSLYLGVEGSCYHSNNRKAGGKSLFLISSRFNSRKHLVVNSADVALKLL